MIHCWIRTSPYTLKDILADGRFKSQIETGYSLNAVEDAELRTKKDGGAVIYGYLCNQENGTPTHGRDLILNEYGTAAVRLSDSIKARTSFCISDSLYQDCELTPYSDEIIPANLDEIIPYVEAQYQSVSIEDIEEVVFQVHEGEREPCSIMATLQECSIPCSVHTIK